MLPYFAELDAVLRMAREDRPEFQQWFGNSKVTTPDGKPLVVYHGMQRGDRLGKALVKRRANSGPMPFFTSDPEIASNYAVSKLDTSLEPTESYADWFRLRVPGLRKSISLDRAWHFLPVEERQRIASLAPRVSRDEDTNEPELRPEGHSTGLGGYDWHQKEARGNHFRALITEWLDSAALFGDEHQFHQVLKLAGFDRPVEFHDPHTTRPVVLPVYLSLQNPLHTAAVPAEVVQALEKAARRQPVPKLASGVDFWDKRTRDPHHWVSTLKSDLAAGNNSHVWTSIPDWVTRTLKGLGYDGIIDSGGKNGGQDHVVYIPFEPHQVKSAIANRGSFDPHSRFMHR